MIRAGKTPLGQAPDLLPLSSYDPRCPDRFGVVWAYRVAGTDTCLLTLHLAGPEGQSASSCLGSPNQSNTSLSKVMISAIKPSSMRSTSIEWAS
jgi:hypothetical protein